MVSKFLFKSPRGQWVNASFLFVLLQALSAVDLHLVMFVCEYVDPAQVFSQAVCPLEQPVLLSLIQQLSADLENNTELKHRYGWTGMESYSAVDAS